MSKNPYLHEISFSVREEELYDQLCALLLTRMRRHPSAEKDPDFIIEKKKHTISIRFGKKASSDK